MDVSGGDGLIQYQEFLVAGCDKRNLLSERNLEKEFEFIDVDKDGFIGPDDIEKFMIENVDPETVEGDEDCQDWFKLSCAIKKANYVEK